MMGPFEVAGRAYAWMDRGLVRMGRGERRAHLQVGPGIDGSRRFWLVVRGRTWRFYRHPWAKNRGETLMRGPPVAGRGGLPRLDAIKRLGRLPYPPAGRGRGRAPSLRRPGGAGPPAPWIRAGRGSEKGTRPARGRSGEGQFRVLCQGHERADGPAVWLWRHWPEGAASGIITPPVFFAEGRLKTGQVTGTFGSSPPEGRLATDRSSGDADGLAGRRSRTWGEAAWGQDPERSVVLCCCSGGGESCSSWNQGASEWLEGLGLAPDVPSALLDLGKGLRRQPWGKSAGANTHWALVRNGPVDEAWSGNWS